MVPFQSQQPEVLDRVPQGASGEPIARPAFLEMGDRLTHAARVIRVADRNGDLDYFVVCACGWVSLGTHFEPFGSERECAVARVMRQGARNVTVFQSRKESR